MKALVWEAPRVMKMREMPEPQMGSGEVLIHVEFAGICGSELSGYLGHNALRVPPLVMGHEFSGVIADIGADAKSRFPNLRAGQAVTVNPLTYDGTCRYCAQGDNHLCVSRKLIGAHRQGAFAEFVSVPAELVMPLPDGMSMRVGALTEPSAVGVRIGEIAEKLDGEDALVVGAGPIGLLTLQALQAKNAERVFIADLDAARLAMGTQLDGIAIDPRAQEVEQFVRAATDDRGVAVSVDCVGTAATRKQCVGATRSGGTVILVGLHEETSAMPAAEVIRREILVRGSFAYSPADFAQALARLARGTMRLDPWTIDAPLADGAKWFERLIAAPGNVSKVLLVP